MLRAGLLHLLYAAGRLRRPGHRSASDLRAREGSRLPRRGAVHRRAGALARIRRARPGVLPPGVAEADQGRGVLRRCPPGAVGVTSRAADGPAALVRRRRRCLRCRNRRCWTRCSGTRTAGSRRSSSATTCRTWPTSDPKHQRDHVRPRRHPCLRLWPPPRSGRGAANPDQVRRRGRRRLPGSHRRVRAADGTALAAEHRHPEQAWASAHPHTASRTRVSSMARAQCAQQKKRPSAWTP